MLEGKKSEVESRIQGNGHHQTQDTRVQLPTLLSGFDKSCQLCVSVSPVYKTGAIPHSHP